MNAVCHKCGSAKLNPLSKCEGCGNVLESDDELALSLMLSDRFMNREKLIEAARLIRSGQKISLPPQVRAAVLGAMAAARRKAAVQQRRQRFNWKAGGILAGAVTILFLFFHPWPHYQIAAFQDNVSALQGFINRFPSSDYSPTAKERIRILRENDVWHAAQTDDGIEGYRNYVRNYPDGKNLDAAKSRITELADAVWEKIALSRSESEIRRFLRDYPETSKISAAEARIQSLYNDWEWVREQDSLEHYKRFVSRNPGHPQKKWIEKRIIDQEVEEIARGDYGELPKAQPVTSAHGAKHAKVTVENSTEYELTVRYSGPDSQKIVIPKGATQTIIMPTGSYRIAASVNAANVRNYYGIDEMMGGSYKSTFYIETRFSPHFKPSSRRKK